MKNVIGIMLPISKSFLYADVNNIECKLSDVVIIKGESGIDSAVVKKEPYLESEDNLPTDSYSVIRVATPEDLKQINDNNEKSVKALDIAKKYSKELGLDMNFVDCFYTFDKSQLIFSFVADNRVDFRELAKKLAQKYKTRIELRQIGVRDKAKKIGGLGPCGLFLCCHTFLTDFNSVSINMAKNQFLALNPSKINGICGRLLCCLGYENDLYTELKKGYPKIGTIVETSSGTGKVSSIDVFKGSFQVDLKEKGFVDIKKEDYHGSSE